MATNISREQTLSALHGSHVDVLIVGGGINGAVSAAALAGRGLSVALAERHDFGAMTSQESSNLVWGGFKYLENYELALVWKLCRSRNELMRSYPTNITEVGFLAALDRTSPYPPWLAALGSTAYWAIGRFATSRPRFFRQSGLARREPVIRTDEAAGGVEYADGYLPENDARFVWSFVRSAIDRGVTAANYLSVDALSRNDGQWSVETSDRAPTNGSTNRSPIRFTATVVVNAAGPWVDELNSSIGVSTNHRIVYSKGIHLVVPQIAEPERVLAFFDDTERLFYVIPMANRSVIGTTDTRTSDPNEPVTDADRRLVLDQINARLQLSSPLTVDDIIAERCGVRPLAVENRTDDGDGDHETEDWTKLSRKHHIEVDSERGAVSIFGGKLTDCLNIGEEVAEAVAEAGLQLSPSTRWWGEPPHDERQVFETRAAGLGLDRPPDIERAESMAQVLWRRHGLAANDILDAIENDDHLAKPITADTDILWAELPAFSRELVVTADDFLRRRTKLAMVHRATELQSDPGVSEALRLLGLTVRADH